MNRKILNEGVSSFIAEMCMENWPRHHSKLGLESGMVVLVTDHAHDSWCLCRDTPPRCYQRLDTSSTAHTSPTSHLRSNLAHLTTIQQSLNTQPICTQVTWLLHRGPKRKLWLCFGLVFHAQHVFANPFNFLVTWGLPVIVFHSMCTSCVYGMALYWFYVSVYVSFVCRYVAPRDNWWVLLQHSIMLRSFFIVECGIARFFCAMRVFEVWASSSSPRLPLCQISFLSWPPLLSQPMEKNRVLNHSPSLSDAPGTEGCTSE